MKYNKMNRQERKLNQKRKREEALRGNGLYVYQNNTPGTLDLPKPTPTGKVRLQPGERFQGDSYYQILVPTMLINVECIVPPGGPQQLKNIPLLESKENPMPEQKLILNQPDRVTEKGTVEHVVVEPSQPLNENKPSVGKPQMDVLLNEDPMEGVEILLNG